MGLLAPRCAASSSAANVEGSVTSEAIVTGIANVDTTHDVIGSSSRPPPRIPSSCASCIVERPRAREHFLPPRAVPRVPIVACLACGSNAIACFLRLHRGRRRTPYRLEHQDRRRSPGEAASSHARARRSSHTTTANPLIRNSDLLRLDTPASDPEPCAALRDKDRPHRSTSPVPTMSGRGIPQAL